MNLPTYTGIKIVLDEEKILSDGFYTLEWVYEELARVCEVTRIKQVDKHHFKIKKPPILIGYFVFHILAQRDWFMNSIKEFV